MTDSTEPTVPLQPETMPGARPVRAGTVTWGVIMVAIAAMFFATAQVDLDKVSGWVILAWGVLALGAVLVVGGLIAALARRSS